MKLEKQIDQKLDMLNKIYEARETDFEKNSQKDRSILNQISHEVKLEEIEEKIEKIFNKLEGDKTKEKQEIINQIELLVENYEIQIAYYNQKNYKRGFKDAMCLYAQCLKEYEF